MAEVLMRHNKALLQHMTVASHKEENVASLQDANASLSLEVLKLNAKLLTCRGEVAALKLQLKKSNADAAESLRNHLKEIQEIKKAFETYQSLQTSVDETAVQDRVEDSGDNGSDNDDADDRVSESSTDSLHPLLSNTPPRNWLSPTVTSQPAAPLDHCILM